MPEIVKKLSGPGVPGSEDFPPMFYVKFTEEEFPKFLADPTTTMKELGHNIDHLTVTVGDSAWVSGKRKWIKSSERPLEDLPPSKSWGWLCGYEDERCVCYPVLM
jgi:hypothetical protein